MLLIRYIANKKKRQRLLPSPPHAAISCSDTDLDMICKRLAVSGLRLAIS